MPCALDRKTGFFNVWKRFITTGATQDVPDNIKHSWLRCLRMGIDPMQGLSPEVLSDGEIEKRVIKTHNLRRHIRNHYLQISKETDLSQFVITFNDADGYLLSIEGHDRLLNDARHSVLKIGSSLGEHSVGTTAPGVCLVEKRPVMVYAEEHYSRFFHWACCLAVPILNHYNEILGTLTIATTCENRRKLEQLSVIFCSVANSFQVETVIKQKIQELEGYRSYFDATFEYAKTPLFLVTPDGSILNMNPKARTGFSLSPVPGRRPQITDILDVDLQNISLMLDKGAQQGVRQVFTRQKQAFEMEIMPIFDARHGEAISYLIKLVPGKQTLPQPSEKTARYCFDHIIGKSRSLTYAVERARKAARMPSNILIEGETGTGKELFAHAIHAESAFRSGPFVAINCSAIPKELIESEFFGYEKGAYTGARKNGSTGKFEQANNGTIFLDEIHTMNLSAQMKILRAIEDRRITRIGGKHAIPLNIRIITATSENLEQEVAGGTFLSALFFRLNVVRLSLPGLRQRTNDIPLLIDAFIDQMNRRFNRNIIAVDRQASEMIMAHTWPGNIRELKNCIESAFNFCETDTITASDLNLPVSCTRPGVQKETVKPNSLKAVNIQMFSNTLEQFGSVKEAAAHLDIPLSTFYRKMKTYGLSK